MDVMVSSYYFHQMAGFLKDPGTFEEFMDTFLEGRGERSHHTEFKCSDSGNWFSILIGVYSVVQYHVVCSPVWKMDRPCEELEKPRSGRQNNVHHL